MPLDAPYSEEELSHIGEAEIDYVQFDVQELKEGLATIPQLWFHFNLAEQLTVKIPAFHVDGFRAMLNMTSTRLAIAWPRGYSKTTIVKLVMAHVYTFDKSIRFITYTSNTHSIAIDECRDVIAMLESDNNIAVFGAPQFETKNETIGKWIFNYCGKKCILRALGAGQQVRGMNIDHQRPQLQIYDDAEDDENTATEMQRIKFNRWVYGPAFKSGAKNSKKIWIGNLVGVHCLIHKFCESEFWDSIKYGCILENGEALWPEMFSIDEIKSDFLEHQEAGMVAKWFAEMMNMPVPDGLGLIKPEEIRYGVWQRPGGIDFGFITIDPAISKRTTANNSAIVVHGAKNGHWQVVETQQGKFDPIELFRVAHALAKKWRIRHIGIEAVAYQASLQSMFRYLLVEQMDYAIEVYPLRAGARKVERIMAWAAWLKNETYLLTFGDSEITQQLLSYDPTKEDNVDDLIDACAYGPQMITEHLNLIMHNSTSELMEKQVEGLDKVCGL